MNRARTAVRIAIPLVWAAAMAGARWLGPWSMIGSAAAILAIAVVATDGTLLRRLLRPAKGTVALGVVAAAAMVAATEILFPPLARSIPALAFGTADLYSGFLLGRPTAAVLAFVIPVVVAEEILWRGAFQEGLRSRSAVATVLVSATLYAAAHAPLGSVLLVAVAFLCGVCWSGLRAASGSLVPPLIAHLAWDLALILVPLRAGSAGA